MDGAYPDPPATTELAVDLPSSAAVAEPPEPLVPVRALPPGIRSVLGRALDLAFGASKEIRRVSVYIGFLTLLVFGPVTILELAAIRALGSDGALELVVDALNGTSEAPARQAVSMLRLSGLLGFLAFFAVGIESQILPVAVLGGIASGRPVGFRRALGLSRRLFWRVTLALIVVGIPRLIAGSLVVGAMAPRTEADAQFAAIVQVVVEAIVTAPFAFVVAGIVLGGVGKIDTIRRSIRIARARWRLAILVASVGAAVSLVQIFALGAGIDVLSRVATALGLGLDGSAPVAVLTSVVVLVGLLALGSLVLTVAALTAAPQVVAFLAMTGYSAGLDDPPGTGSPHRRARLITWPMIGMIVLAAIAAAVGIASL